ncbi:MAG: gluconokinase [Cyanobacteria bacterium SW_6_48_11]|nr:MAG: gluconokinase [Cyanobacteria bacterium QS_1_48_34]PSO83631.1 MAG: gluconokinase [Cyanobacteria bacterium QS_5_48_63]PSO95764.1 MAG: gluconokinase [Cyanobacteria bacterium SW_6_48_11]
MGYVIGVDVGTTSTKSVLFTQKGEVVKQHTVSYSLHVTTPGAAKQDPDEIFAAVIKTVGKVIEDSKVNPARVLCLSLSAAMHSLIAVDAAGKPITKSLTWADNRSAKWAKEIKQAEYAQEIYLATGTPIHSSSPLSKLVWLRQEYPELFKQAAKFISIKEYIVYCLFQTYVVDYAIAAATGLLNLQQLSWDHFALEVAGIDESKLSQLVPTTHLLHSMQTEYQEAMGLAAETPLVMGASDGVLSNLGVGAVSPRVVAVTVGTSGAIRAMVDKPRTDAQQRLFCYPLTESHWVIGGAVNSGGVVLRWVREQLADSEVATAKHLDQNIYDILSAIAATVPPGSEGLIFHPYLTGERSPLWDAHARGSFFGLGLHHTKAHLIRAVLEGVVYNLYLVLQALENVMGEATSIHVAGGFTQSLLWRQILADVFHREITLPAVEESSCFGAAVLGLYALKEIPALERVDEMIGEMEKQQAITQNVEVYQKILPVYTRLLEKFKGEYASIAHLHSRTFLSQEG